MLGDELRWPDKFFHILGMLNKGGGSGLSVEACGVLAGALAGPLPACPPARLPACMPSLHACMHARPGCLLAPHWE